MSEIAIAPELLHAPIADDDVELTRPMTYEQWQALPEEGPLIEWVDGNAIFHMPATPKHQSVADYLTVLLSLFVNLFRLGRVISSPVEMRLRRGISREPDVLFISSEHLSRLDEERRLEGPADLAIEVVSGDSVKRDRVRKFEEYERYGVAEYWILDPRTRTAAFFQRDAAGRFKPIAPEGGVYRSSAVKGFWLRVEWLWEQPDPQLTFAEIAGFSPQFVDEIKRLKGN